MSEIVRYLHPTKGWKKGEPIGQSVLVERNDGTVKKTPGNTKRGIRFARMNNINPAMLNA